MAKRCPSLVGVNIYVYIYTHTHTHTYVHTFCMYMYACVYIEQNLKWPNAAPHWLGGLGPRNVALSGPALKERP